MSYYQDWYEEFEEACRERDLLDERITQVIEHLDRCAIMRVEPNKYSIRKLLTGEESYGESSDLG